MQFPVSNLGLTPSPRQYSQRRGSNLEVPEEVLDSFLKQNDIDAPCLINIPVSSLQLNGHWSPEQYGRRLLYQIKQCWCVPELRDD